MNYTSIEQSKKLLELGLKPETADMSWEKVTHDLKEDFSWEVFLGPNPAIKMNTFSFRNGYVLPCWSVGALLEIMSFHIIKGNQRYAFGLHKGLNKNGETFMFRYNIFNTDIILYETECYNSPIEAAYNMVVWLLENNYIKTE